MLKNAIKKVLFVVLAIVVVLSSVSNVRAFEYGGAVCDCVPTSRTSLIPPRCICTQED